MGDKIDIVPFYAQLILRKESKGGKDTYSLFSNNAHISTEVIPGKTEYADISFELPISKEIYELIQKKRGEKGLCLRGNLELKVE
ncbi:hypothetical protein BMS3Abin17_00929 [archaeon BMS3Abin17]|nr:hypothetical protein BMS3Abin17_00929 [archaeon BMS3Abin17]HDZ60494.1 hypothetical protein [Candidatus Pacearchaeota archaeon]